MAAIPSTTIGLSQAPGQYPLSLGGVTFNSSECPEELPIGVEQMLAEHTLIGGSRIVQAFGIKPQDIAWSGKIFGTQVAFRIAQLRLYAVAGQAIPMRWRGEGYQVVIKDFTPKFHGQYAEYAITLAVVNDLSGAYYTASSPSIDQQVAALQSSANSLVTTISTAASAAPTYVAPTAVGSSSIVTVDNTGSFPDESLDATAIQNANNAVNTALNNASPISVNAAAQQTALQSSLTSALAAVATFQAAMPATHVLMPTAIQLYSTYELMSRNIANGYSEQTLQMQGGSLFSVAAQYYGDVSQAFNLASANGLHSPFLPSAIFSSVKIPPQFPPVTSSS